MKHLPLLLALLIPAAARADPALQAYARLQFCSLSADGQHLAVQPCRTAPARQPQARRAVTQIIDPLPASPVPRPLNAPRPPAPAAPSTPTASRGPIPITGCDPGGCYDASGQRYNNAGSGVTLTPSGKLCNRNGTWLQCQ